MLAVHVSLVDVCLVALSTSQAAGQDMCLCFSKNKTTLARKLMWVQCNGSRAVWQAGVWLFVSMTVCLNSQVTVLHMV